MPITGLFELHLIIEPTPYSEAKLFSFCIDKKDNGGLINLRATCAQTFYGKHPRQPMLTSMFRGTEEEAVTMARSLETEMTTEGMVVTRVKVEAMASNAGVPNSTTQNVPSCRYFEFHFKVHISSSAEWNRLNQACVPHGAHLFFNPYSQTGRMQPVVTLRRYVSSFEEALSSLDQLISSTTTAGFPSPDGVEREYSILDTNVGLDEGWLFRERPDNFITVV